MTTQDPRGEPLPDAKPCPFCGGKPVLDGPENRPEEKYGKAAWVVRCASCAAQGGWSKTRSSALDYWSWRK